MRSRLQRLASLAAVAVALAALGLLWRFRPAWPQLPQSPAAPLTTAAIEQIALLAVWALAAIVILVLLALRAGRMGSHWSLNLTATTTSTAGGWSHVPLRRTRMLPSLPGPSMRPELRIARASSVVVSPRADVDVATTPIHAGEPAYVDDRPLISLLGPLAIEGATRSRKGLRLSALELIAFLAIHEQGAQRDKILEALWPGEDPRRSRHRLYQAVRDARRLLGEAVASERDRYWLDRKRVRVDVDQLDAILEEARRSTQPERVNQLAERALALFRAEPLTDCDYSWLDGELPKLRAKYVDLLKRVGHARLRTGEAQGALEAAERGLAIDTLDEELWRLALEAEAALGLRAAVEERYGRLSQILGERLGLEPGKETRSLYRRLLAQDGGCGSTTREQRF